jgi:hypothetical protein
MTREERSFLEGIDKMLLAEEVRAQIQPVVERVRAQLHRKTATVMAWEPIPLSIYGDALPAMIRSSWVFILRAGTNTGAERHPNSHQRMMSFEGSGDMQVGDDEQTSDVGSQRSEGAIRWQSNVLVSDPDARLERRWISIPENVWHRPVVSKEADWVVVSFHTVPAEELIEERPIDHAASRTKQMVYLDKR